MQELNIDDIGKILNRISQDLDKIRFNLGLPKYAGQETLGGEDKKHVDKEWFSNICYSLLKMKPDDKFKEALTSFPKNLEKYGSLTAKQWKFFSVIHRELTGDWPKEGQKIEHKSKSDFDLGDIF